MNRRDSIAALIALAAAPLARAQQAQSVPRVGYLFSFLRSQGGHLWQACRQGLLELGYIDGRNIELEPRWAEGRHERLPDLVAELVRLKVNLIVAAATPANRAAKKGAGTLPIVMVAVADPVRQGLVESLARPGGTMTGLSLLTPELSGKRVELLREIVPKMERLAAFVNPDNDSHAVFLEETNAAAAGMRLAVQSFHLRNPAEIERAFAAAAAQGVQGAIVFDDPAIWSFRRQIVALAAKTKLPTMYGYSEFVDEGGLDSFGPHRPDLYRRTAGYVDKILKGANPAELPIERPTRFELVVHPKAAKALGLTLPQSLLVRADQVIE